MNEQVAPQLAPRQIKRIVDPESARGAGLEVVWSDGLIATISSQQLRSECPCATCREQRGSINHEKPLAAPKRRLAIITHSAEEGTDLTSVWAVGNYAIGIRWGDRHDSGIVSYEQLRELSKTAMSAVPR